MNQHKRLCQLLTYLGAIPFIALTIARFILPPEYNEMSVRYYEYYAVVILCFLAGTHWGIALMKESEISKNLIYSSNAVALYCFAVLMLINQFFSFLVMIIMLLWLLYSDKCLRRAHLTPDWYYKMRVAISFVVLATLVIQGLSSNL